MKKCLFISICILPALALFASTAFAQFGWTPQVSGTPQTLYGVSFSNANTGIAVGATTTTVGTTTSGSVWAPQLSTVQTGDWELGVSMPDPMHAWIAGQNGQISYTFSAGTSWSPESSGTTNHLFGIDFFNDTVGISVGLLGTIIQTTNWGNLWVKDTSHTTMTLYGVTFRNKTSAVAVGGNAVILRSYQLGTGIFVWSTVSVGSAAALYGVSFPDSLHGWVVGTGGTILRSTDGGLNWATQTCGTSANLFGVSFSDSITGTAVGDSGIILHTLNGGNTWVRQPSGTLLTLQSVSMVSATTGWAVGGNGTILKTVDGGFAPPTFVASPSTVDFGSLQMSIARTNHLVVANGGQFTLHIDSCYTDNPVFSINKTASTIPPSASDSFSVSFNASAEGFQTGHLIFISNSYSSPDTVTCKGSRVAYVIGGTAYNDRNANGRRDSGEPGLQGWTVTLRQLRTVTPIAPQTTLTDVNGHYEFDGLPDGTYLIGEVSQDNFVKTYPSAPGTYEVTIANGSAGDGLDFGNAPASQFAGSPGGPWSSPGNWLSGHLPGDSDAVELHVPVTYDVAAQETLGALRIGSGASLMFSPTSAPLTINGSVVIDSGASLEFADGPDQTLICKGDWLNQGNIQYGTSTVVFAGDKPKSIDASGFWNLAIQGDSTYTLANAYVQHQLILEKALIARSVDTVFISSDTLNAITYSGTGKVRGGSINRKIHNGETGAYTFESESTFVQFYPTGIYPTSFTMGTTLPKSKPRSYTDLKWFHVQSTVDTITNTWTVDSIGHFSTLTPGRPSSGGILPKIAAVDSSGTPSVLRSYKLSPYGGSGFLMKVRLHFESLELGSDHASELELLRGPFSLDSVRKGWNMLSLPVTPESFALLNIFPTASSNAFSYSGGYQTQSSLQNDVGYWIKFPNAAIIPVLGTDRPQDSVTVASGWNMIGTSSYAFGVASVVTSPPGLVSGVFYGYKNGYYVADTLRPGQGYWAKAGGSGVLIVGQPDTALSLRTASTPNFINSMNSLTIRDQSDGVQTLYFGSSEKANPAQFDMPPLPPRGVFDARFSTNRIAEFTDQKRSKETGISVSSATYPLSLGWDAARQSGIFSLMVDGHATALRGKGNLTIVSPQSTIALVMSAASTTVPKEFALYQNYPNPFNPSTTIMFDLPSNAFVTLKVFNVLGQEVASVVENKLYRAGTYGESFTASRLASGVYFYQITAQGIADASGKISGSQFVQTRKLLLLK